MFGGLISQTRVGTCHDEGAVGTVLCICVKREVLTSVARHVAMQTIVRPRSFVELLIDTPRRDRKIADK